MTKLVSFLSAGGDGEKKWFNRFPGNEISQQQLTKISHTDLMLDLSEFGENTVSASDLQCNLCSPMSIFPYIVSLQETASLLKVCNILRTKG